MAGAATVVSEMIDADRGYRTILLPFGLLQVAKDSKRLDPSSGNFDLLRANWGDKFDHIAFTRFEQSTGDWRNPCHLAFQTIGFVDSQNRDRALIACLLHVSDCGAKKNLVFAVMRARVCDFRNLLSLSQKADASVYFAQTFFTVEVVAVF